MKKTLVLLFLFVNLFSFSQEKKVIKSGYITFNSNSILEFKNLTIENGNATYFNEVSKTETTYSLASIKTILDGFGAVVYEADKKPMVNKVTIDPMIKNNTAVIANKSEEEKLVYQSASKIYMNSEKVSDEKLETLLKNTPIIYEKYKKGKSGASLGSILIGGGIGLFIGGGLSNLSNASSGGGGGPALLIIGIATSIVGIPVRLAGVKTIKEAIDDYNSAPKKQVSFFQKSELKVIVNGNGIGFHFRP